jgi:hypothetical protein
MIHVACDDNVIILYFYSILHLCNTSLFLGKKKFVTHNSFCYHILYSHSIHESTATDCVLNPSIIMHSLHEVNTYRRSYVCLPTCFICQTHQELSMKFGIGGGGGLHTKLSI